MYFYAIYAIKVFQGNKENLVFTVSICKRICFKNH